MNTDFKSKAVKLASSFEPVKAHKIILSAIHPLANDFTRQYQTHHYVSQFEKDGRSHFYQGVIFDSDKDDAKLIGLQYIVSDDIFSILSDEEKRKWHSYQYEVDSGILLLQGKLGTPGPIADRLERPLMETLRTCYAKTILTWQVDLHPDLPLDKPQLLMSFTADDQVKPEKLRLRDTRIGVDSHRKSEWRRKEFAPYSPIPRADAWQGGRVPQLQWREVDVKSTS